MVATAERERVSQPAPASVWGKAHRRLTIGLALTVAGAALEAISVATIMPAAVRDLGGLALYGWAFSAFMLTNLVGITIAGAEADRNGPARLFVAGVALFALGLLISGTAPSMVVVIAGRSVQGLGAGIIGSVAYVAVGRAYPEAAKPRMLAILSSAWVVPGLIGPALAGLVAASAGWRWVFLGLVPLLPVGAAMALPSLRRLEHSVSAARDWRRLIDAVRLAAGAGLLMAGLGTTARLVTVVLVAGGAALAIPALRRLLPPGTLRAAKGLPAGIATAGLLNLAFFGVDAFVPLTLTTIRHQRLAVAGIPLTAATLGWTAGSWLQSHYAPTGRRRLLVEIGLALIAAGAAGIMATLVPQVPAVLAPIAWGVGGLGMGLAFSTISLLVLESAAPGKEGAASASLQLANVLGSALGTGGGGLIIGRAVAGSPSGAALLTQDILMLVAVALTALAALRMPNRRPND